MTRETDIDLLAKALCDSMAHADPDEDEPWDDLHEYGRAYYRQRIKDVLLHDTVLLRLLLDRPRDDGTEIAVGGEPGASAGNSE